MIFLSDVKSISKVEKDEYDTAYFIDANIKLFCCTNLGMVCLMSENDSYLLNDYIVCDEDSQFKLIKTIKWLSLITRIANPSFHTTNYCYSNKIDYQGYGDYSDKLSPITKFKLESSDLTLKNLSFYYNEDFQKEYYESNNQDSNHLLKFYQCIKNPIIEIQNYINFYNL